jgi:hypothetical protein
MTNKQRKEQFKKDDEWGQWGEETLIPFIEMVFNQHYYKHGKKISWDTKHNKTYHYDLRFLQYDKNSIFPDQKSLTFEIKTDKFDRTGNLVFEIGEANQKGDKLKVKDKGIYQTEADYFIYFLPRYSEKNLYIFKSSILREFLKKSNYHTTWGGDKGTTKMFKVTKADFDEILLKENLGKVYGYNSFEIPERFSVKRFAEESGRVIYKSDKITIDKIDYEKLLNGQWTE